MYKKSIITGVICVTLSLSTAIGANAGSISWSNSYGKGTGSSSTYTWSQGGSPTYRKTNAVTQNNQAAPKIAAEVHGYKPNGTKVISVSKTASNASSVSAVHNSEKYANVSIHGNGIHAVWSSTLTRKNHVSEF